MLALATTIGDRIHKELAVYGANIVVYPKADQLEVKVGGVDIKPASGGAYLKESDLEKLKGIFWANNITGVSPELRFTESASRIAVQRDAVHSASPCSAAIGSIIHFGTIYTTGALALHPWWKLRGQDGPTHLLDEHCDGTESWSDVAWRNNLARDRRSVLDAHLRDQHDHAVLRYRAIA